jgi:MFS family permease
MSSIPAAVEATDRSARRFLGSFMVLAVISGLTIGMGRVITTFYALSVGATTAQIGFISAAEALGKMVVTLPAGFLVHRFGARRIYSTATIGSMVLSLAVPFTKLWYGVAAMRALVALCVPFRVISMNSSFLQRLPQIGNHRAGWYRGSQSLGVSLLGPIAGGALLAGTNYWVSYAVISASFAFMALFSRTFLPEEDAVEATDAGAGTSPIGELLQMLRQRRVAESCFIEFISSSTLTLFTTFIIVLAVKVAGLTDHQAVFLMSMQGIAAVAALFVLGPLLRRVSVKAGYVIAVPGAIGALVMLGTSHSIVILAVAALLLSVAAALVHLANMIELSGAAFSKSKLASVYNLSGMLGALFGSLAGGLLSEAIGLGNMFLIWIAVLATAVCVCVLRRAYEPAAAAGSRKHDK